jgi:hypothetical protein
VLRANAQASVVELAEGPGLSRATVQNRMRRLEEFHQRERVSVADVGKICREIELIVFLDHEADTER